MAAVCDRSPGGALRAKALRTETPRRGAEVSVRGQKSRGQREPARPTQRGRRSGRRRSIGAEERWDAWADRANAKTAEKRRAETENAWLGEDFGLGCWRLLAVVG